MTTGKTESATDATALPKEPTQLQDSNIAKEVRAALSAILDDDAQVFAEVFGLSRRDEKNLETDTQVKRVLETRLTRARDTLVSNGLLFQDDSKYYRSTYLVTPWHGMFYITDFPDSGDRDEVFSPHVETKFFTSLLQVRPTDEVLDLCSGGGILLLDALRRGAKAGTGIDKSSRAVHFSRANAALNELDEVATFIQGDVTIPGACENWGKPSVVISNPPFEPVPDDPGFPPRPYHSDGGPFGTSVVSALFENLNDWQHNPSVIQFVLFALGKARGGNSKDDGRHIDLVEDLMQTALAKDAILDVRELLRSIRIDDYRVLNFGRGRRESVKWFENLRKLRYETLHLIFANLYPGAKSSRFPNNNTRWIRHEDSGREDECFVWPLSSVSRGSGHRYLLGEANLHSQYIKALIETREETMAGRKVDLALQDDHVRTALEHLIKDDSMFDGTSPIVLVDIQRSSNLDSGSLSVVSGVATIESDGKAVFNEITDDRLESHIQEVFSRRRVGVTVCDARENPDGKGHINYYVDIGELNEIVADVKHLRPADHVIQRFVAFTAPDKCLSPARQKFFANVLSEMVGVADRERAKAFEALQNAGFVFGHDLKNRMEELRYQQARNALRSGSPRAVEMAEICLQKLSTFSATPELFRVLAKFVTGVLPGEWINKDLAKDWPKSFNPDDHLAKVATACDIIVRQVVSPYARDVNDANKNKFELRRIEGDSLSEMQPIDFVESVDLPPLSNWPSAAPPFAILAGLTEIVRNAVRATIDDSKRSAIITKYDSLHLDYRIDVDPQRAQVTVNLWNPFSGQAPPSSETIGRMENMYKRLGAVDVIPVNTRTPHPLFSRTYGYSAFIFRPGQLRFEKARARSHAR